MKHSQITLFQEERVDERPKRVLKTKSDAANQYVSSVWSFPGNGGNQLYRWYGTLPRPLVERLASLYTKDTSRILDAFAGLGTTLDVAADNGHKAIGLDVNPLACLATEARLYGLPPRDVVLKLVDRVILDLGDLSGKSTGAHDQKWSGILAEPKYDYPRKWFRKDTLDSVLRLFFRIAAIDDVRVQRFLFVAASQVVREVASVDPRCTHHLVTKQKPYIDPLPLWRKMVVEGFDAVRPAPAIPAKISIAQASILTSKLGNDSADFVLMHPPYLGVIHYHLIHRLATDMLDIVNRIEHPDSLKKFNFDYERLKANDISTDNTEKYQKFVGDLAEKMQQVVAADGRCVVIIGDQRHKGNLRHPFTDFIACFERAGFSFEEMFVWILQNNGGMHVLRRGHFIDHNYVLVFHKETKA